jgi:alcohol dehydrogenase
MQGDDRRFVYNWNYPTRVWFGPGRISEIAKACSVAHIKRPLVVTDPGLAGLPQLEEMMGYLRSAGLEASLFSGVRPNPTSANVENGVAALKAGRHDGVIAFGGGSALDAGKTIAFMVAQKRPVWDFEDIGDYWTRASEDGILPIIAIPTTAGTGSEVGRATVITDEVSHAKKIIFHPRMMPQVALCDPLLTVSLPPHLTAATGMDALSHCIEAYCAPGYHPMADAIALEGARLVKLSLEEATHSGANVEARANMMAAAAMGATAFQKGLGAIHSLSHPIGSLFGVHHGLINGVLMPYVLASNAPAIGEKMQRLATHLNLANGDAEDGTRSVIAWVVELRRKLQIPHTTRDLDIPVDRFSIIAALAIKDPTAPTNPRTLTAELAMSMLERSSTGDHAP